MTCMPFLPVRICWRLGGKAAVAGLNRFLQRHALAHSLFCFFGSIAIACTLHVSPARADSWQAQLYNEGLPSHLVAVDKARQTFMFFEKKSPLKLKYAYPCTTGQLRGDKQALNDLRTPEGIYFVEYKIANGLDFKEYGGIAYTLNYPNPVDKLRGKTGHGIWIHSKGFGIEPLSTRGCVAIGLKDIDEVGPSLIPGTAVVLAESLDEKAQPRPDKAGTVHELRRLMQDWSNAWASRSTKLFDYYDQNAYTKAMPETFAAFRQNKERLFKMLRFIKIFNRKIHVLQGPGYWVTWSEQLYTASNLSTEGIRRLYWQRGNDKKFRIVGMEWTPRNLGMHAAYSKGQLVAEAPIMTISDASSEAPRPPRLDMPEAAPDSEARPGPPLQDTAAGKSAETLLAAASAPLVPQRDTEAALPPAEVNWGVRPSIPEQRNDRRAMPETPTAPPAPAQETLAPTSVIAPAQAPAGIAPATAQGNAQPTQRAAQSNEQQAAQPLPPTSELRSTLEARVAQWNKEFAARSTAIGALYDQVHFNRIKNVPRGASYANTMRNLEQWFKNPWLRLISHKPRITVQSDVALSESPLLIISPKGMEQGTLSLWWQQGSDAVYHIVASNFKPMELGLTVDWLEQVSGDISTVVEQWRAAWERADLNAYMTFYTDDALQQGRRGAQHIRKHKESLWQRVRPARVQISGLRLMPEKQGIRADMAQTYTNASGHTDKGVKTLLLRYNGTAWRIAREDWAVQTPLAGSVTQSGT